MRQAVPELSRRVESVVRLHLRNMFRTNLYIAFSVLAVVSMCVGSALRVPSPAVTAIRVPVWSLLAGFAKPDGKFVVAY